MQLIKSAVVEVTAWTLTSITEPMVILSRNLCFRITFTDLIGVTVPKWMYKIDHGFHFNWFIALNSDDTIDWFINVSPDISDFMYNGNSSTVVEPQACVQWDNSLISPYYTIIYIYIYIYDTALEDWMYTMIHVQYSTAPIMLLCAKCCYEDHSIMGI